jgi:hypothetical protein
MPGSPGPLIRHNRDDGADGGEQADRREKTEAPQKSHENTSTVMEGECF